MQRRHGPADRGAQVVERHCALHVVDAHTGPPERDQVAALAWVRANIRSFGGDPELWLRMQMAYDLWQARNRMAAIDVRRFDAA